MAKEADINILWLSDIHFKSLDYYEKIKVNDDLVAYRECFIRNLKQCHESDEITHILLSGDIVNTGTSLEYDHFLEFWLQPIFDNLKSSLPIRVICVPGNHDVERGVKQELEDIMLALLDKNKYNVLKEKTNYFEKQFAHYNQFLKKISDIGYTTPYADTLDNNWSVEFSEDAMKLHLLCHDNEYGVSFSLINSSLYSLGGKFGENFYEYVTSLADEKREDLLRQFVSLSEFGNQILALHNLNYWTSNSFVSNYRDSVSIFVTHHPFHWCDWHEYHTIDKQASVKLLQHCNGTKEEFDKIEIDERINLKSAFLSRLIEESSLCLSGHEHPPYTEAIDYRKGKNWFLKAGMFLPNPPRIPRDGEVSKCNEDFLRDLDACWYSILNINQKRSFCKRSAFVKDILLGDEVFDLMDKYDNLTLKDGATHRLKQKLIDRGNHSSIMKMEKGEFTFWFRDDVLNVSFYLSKAESPKKIFIVFEDFAFKTEHFELLFVKIVDCLKDPIEEVCFGIVDLLVDPQVERTYLLKETGRREVFSRVTRAGDQKFNEFRVAFFNKLNEGKHHNINKIDTICMVCDILPHWIIDKQLWESEKS